MCLPLVLILGSLVFQGVVKYNAINNLPTSSENFMTDKSLDELKNAFNALLDIPNVEVDEVEIDRDGNYRVTVHSAEHGTHCHKCGNFIDHFYGHGEFIYRCWAGKSNCVFVRRGTNACDAGGSRRPRKERRGTNIEAETRKRLRNIFCWPV
jgi:hypothetical protein